jgi:hypothetical protein
MFSVELSEQLNKKRLKDINLDSTVMNPLLCKITKLSKERILSELLKKKSINSILNEDEFFKKPAKILYLKILINEIFQF